MCEGGALYSGGCFNSKVGDILSNVRDILNTVGDISITVVDVQ